MHKYTGEGRGNNLTWLKKKKKKAPTQRNIYKHSADAVRKAQKACPGERKREEEEKKTVIITFLNGNEKEEIC